jgi:hypothetical protein
MTQNLIFYKKDDWLIYQQNGAGADPVMALARSVFQRNGQLQQPLIRFLEWAKGQLPSKTPGITLFNLVEAQGSERSKQEIRGVTERASSNKTLFPTQAAAIVLQTVENLEKAVEIPQLHSLVKEAVLHLKRVYSQEVVDKNRQTEEGISMARLFLLNQVGLRTLQIVLPWRYGSLRRIIQKFYLDDHHPMDLQKLFRDPMRAPRVGYVIKNLAKIHHKACLLTRHFAFLAPRFFNTFLTIYIQTVPPEKKKANLLGIPTTELNIPYMRQIQESYYLRLGISKERIDSKLQFSTPKERKGLYLYPKGETPPQVEQTFRMNVPDADNRTVEISQTGFQFLEKLQIQNRWSQEG